MKPTNIVMSAMAAGFPVLATLPAWSQSISTHSQANCAQQHFVNNSAETVQCVSSFDNGSESAAGYAAALYGSLHASAGAGASSSINREGANYILTPGGSGSATVTDSMIISSAGRVGTGLMTFAVHIDSSVSAASAIPGSLDPADAGGGAVTAAVLTTLAIAGKTFQTESAADSSVSQLEQSSHIYQIVNGVNGVDPTGTFIYSVPFVFGQALSLYMNLEASAVVNQVYRDGLAVGSADAMYSFDWAGIQNITFGGEAVDYTVTSLSGTDYTQSFAPAVPTIPEPNSYLLTLMGLAAILFATKRASMISIAQNRQPHTNIVKPQAEQILALRS